VEGAHGSADEALPDVTTADASVDVYGARVTLSVTPRPPIAFSRMRFRVRVEFASAKASADGSSGALLVLEGGRISFEMTMPMGDHRYDLVPGADGWQEAEVVLPTCQSGDPRWYAIVEGTVAGRPIKARFRLDLEKPGSTPTDSAPTIPQGFYRGKAGDVTVSVCFDAEGARYYDESVGKTVDLVAIEARPGSYLLSPPSHPRGPEDFDPDTDAWWVLAERSRKLTGAWHVGTQASAIAIDKVADSCEAGFEAGRSGRAPVNRETVQADSVVLQRVVHPLTGTESVRIRSGLPDQGVRAINDRLATIDLEDNQRWAACEDFESSLSPIFVSRAWLVFESEHEGFCGGPGRFLDSGTVAFASDTGEYIDFGTWIEGFSLGAVSGKLQRALVREIRRSWKEAGYAETGDFCVENLESSALTPWMDASGCNFRLNTGNSQLWTCVGDYGIPFQAMRPFVTKPYLQEYDRFASAARELAKATPARVTELRQAIDILRARHGLSAFAWTDHVFAAGDASVKAVHMIDLGTALHEAFVKAGSSEAFTPGKAPNILEIQSAVLSLFRLGQPDKGHVR
jgi:hypothetical protein